MCIRNALNKGGETKLHLKLQCASQPFYRKRGRAFGFPRFEYSENANIAVISLFRRILAHRNVSTKYHQISLPLFLFHYKKNLYVSKNFLTVEFRKNSSNYYLFSFYCLFLNHFKNNLQKNKYQSSNRPNK